MDGFEIAYRVSLIGTFAVLVWYAWETRKIRQVTVQQKDLQSLPAMMIYIRSLKGANRPVIRNIGPGTAVAVDIDECVFSASDEDLKFKFRLTGGNNTLIPEEERELFPAMYINGEFQEKSLENFGAHFIPSHLRAAQKKQQESGSNEEPVGGQQLKVRFKDIGGQEYITVIAFEPEGISVISEPKRTSS